MRLSRTIALSVTALLTLAAAACSSQPEAEQPDQHAFATVEHIYGTTVIPEKPERVATIGWGNHEVPLALGIVPVGMAKITYGDDDDNGVLPWVEAKLAELGAETPVLFDETDGIDFEAIADTTPDVILAAYSGLTQEEYDTLSKIAPVVAYPSTAWGTSLDEMIDMNATALGLKAEGQQLIEDLRTESADILAAYPQLQDTKVLFTNVDPSDLSQIIVYTLPDTRPGFLSELGLPQATILQELSAENTSFYATVSSDEAERFADVDVMAFYGNPDGDLAQQMQADPLLAQIPAIANGRLAIFPDDTPLATMPNPTPLSIAWGLDDYLALLASAAASH